ncbi:MAG: TA system VapC family ribonuclease toxin [Terracidiphilus sp.]
MNPTKPRYLLDLNALIALADHDHELHEAMQEWFISFGRVDWGVCPLTEAGFIRVTANPNYRPTSRTIAQATAVLADFATHPGYRYWPIAEKWAALTAPFSARLLGHQQVTDAYLLGLAVKEGGVLVTFDKAIKYLAGAEYSGNVLVLDAQ